MLRVRTRQQSSRHLQSQKGRHQRIRPIREATHLTVRSLTRAPPASSTVERDASTPRPESGRAGSKDAKPTTLPAAASNGGGSEARSISAGRQVEEALMGVSFAGSPTVRHDGIVVYTVQTQGPADNIDIQPGDVILAIDGHYLYTIEDLRAELLRHDSGARVAIRYRHYRLTSENYIILGSRGSDSQR